MRKVTVYQAPTYMQLNLSKAIKAVAISVHVTFSDGNGSRARYPWEKILHGKLLSIQSSLIFNVARKGVAHSVCKHELIKMNGQDAAPAFPCQELSILPIRLSCLEDHDWFVSDIVDVDCSRFISTAWHHCGACHHALLTRQISRSSPIQKRFLAKDRLLPLAKAITMFNVNITALFAGAFPGSLLVPANTHKSAIQFYRVRLRARVVKWTARSAAVLESVYGFRICVERSSSARSSSSVRLSLHSSVDRMRIANTLGAGAPVRESRGGIKVTDPYGVIWTLA
eukprot:IDg23926t1